LLPLGICALPLGPGPVPMLPVLLPLGPGAGVAGVTFAAGTVVVGETGAIAGAVGVAGVVCEPPDAGSIAAAGALPEDCGPLSCDGPSMKNSVPPTAITIATAPVAMAPRVRRRCVWVRWASRRRSRARCSRDSAMM